ncbi:MAG: hypothetical protein LBS25_06510 [Candidatus Symbiothrix sp.]|jgi:hypothetical protein|nr:hypothetical protein [Candidatus Symbiothrix sp.]
MERNEINDNIHVLETIVPVEKQMEYFRYTESVRRNLKNESIEDLIEYLENSETPLADQKYILSILAVSGNVKAFRAIEAYSRSGFDPALRDWVAMSILQAKITLESEFSDERQVFIFSGLGGKGNHLRFYAFFRSNQLQPFTDYQRDLIRQEFFCSIQKYKGETEEIKIERNYFYILFLIHLEEDITKMMQDALNECNEYGDFIRSDFIVTNVKRFDEYDIERELKRQ